MTYTNVISVPAKNTCIYDIHYYLFPSGARAFSIARTTLHTLRERIHVLSKKPQDISRSPHPRCAVMASHMLDTQPLPYDRDCSQVNLVLKGRVWDSHHPVGGFLPSYLIIGASL
jgi:hypothetical protein